MIDQNGKIKPLLGALTFLHSKDQVMKSKVMIWLVL